MAVPEVGIKFRIFSARIGEMLGGPVDDSNEEVGTNLDLPRSGQRKDYEYFDGTWFTLEQTGKPDYFYIKHCTTGRCIYANINRAEVGLCGVRGYEDQWWQFGFEKDDKFQLFNSFGGKLFFRDHANPRIGITPNNVYNYGDQYFSFFFEGFEVESVDFNLDRGNILARTPRLVAQQTFRNSTSVEQSQSFSVTYTQTKQHYWSYTGGFRITAEMGVSFKASVPFFGESDASFKLGAETSQTWTTSTITTEQKQLQFEFPITVPPGKTVEARALLSEDSGEVPYEMTIRFESSHVTTKTYGKWHGLQCVRIFNEITEI